MSPPASSPLHQEEEDINNTNSSTSTSTSLWISNNDCDPSGGGGDDDTVPDSDFYEFVRWHLPKVELHAHLNGCIPLPLLQELARERGVTLHSQYFRVAEETTNNHHSNVGGGAHNQNSTTKAPLPPDMYNLHPRSLQDCFDMFAELPSIVNDLMAVRRITHAALQEFACHHVAYLELRSTPKRLLYHHHHHHHGNIHDTTTSSHDKDPSLCTKKEYCQAILQIMHDFQEQEQLRYERDMADFAARGDCYCSNDNDNEFMGNTAVNNNHINHRRVLPRLPLVCRFLVSIDRAQSLAEAEENVNLAIALRQQQQQHPSCSWSRLVVGMDLGGNPTRQDFQTFRPCLQKARDHGLKVTLHCGEIPCADHPQAYREASDMLDFGPDRLGHAVLLPPDLLRRLEQLQIPVETCPTSNVMTLELHHHHHQEQQEQQHGNSNEKSQHGDLVHGLRQHPSLRHWLRVSNGNWDKSKESNGDNNNNNNNNFYPLTIGTDDPGVFDTTATQELWLLATAFRLDRQQLSRIIVDSVRYAFCDLETQNQLHQQIQERLQQILL